MSKRSQKPSRQKPNNQDSKPRESRPNTASTLQTFNKSEKKQNAKKKKG